MLIDCPRESCDRTLVVQVHDYDAVEVIDQECRCQLTTDELIGAVAVRIEDERERDYDRRLHELIDEGRGFPW